MPMVGDRFYRRIEGLPACARDACTKRVERRGGSIMSAYCLDHTRLELDRLMAEGLRFDQARRQIWEGRPRARLTFIP